jgi:multidrug efflux pump subunit AcrB
MLVAYAGLISATVGLLWVTPTGFIPAQDQGYFLTVIQLPPGSSLDRTDAVLRKVVERILPIEGVEGSVMLAGFDGASQTLAPNSAAAYVPLKSFEERAKLGVTFQGIMDQARARTADINEGPPAGHPAAAHPGHRLGGRLPHDDPGCRRQRLSGAGRPDLRPDGPRQPDAGAGAGLQPVRYRHSARLCRHRSRQGGHARRAARARFRSAPGLSRLCLRQRLQPAWPHLSSDGPGRRAVPIHHADVANLRVRSNSGEMVPIGSVATFRDESGPHRVVRYNLLPAVEVDGDTAPGYSSGQSLRTMERVAAETLAPGYRTEWTGIAYQQEAAGNTAPLVFALAVLFVFLGACRPI